MGAGLKIKQVRTSRGMTQQELATQAGINLRTIQRIENEEVLPRTFTLKTIAKVLKMEESELLEFQTLENGTVGSKKGQVVLGWLHLSGILLLPTFLIWYFEKKDDPEINLHGADVINFQLSMLAVLLPCLFFPGIPQIIALFTLVVVTINTIRVFKGKSYYYPLTIRMIKP
jgi:transcriptional regulator with XRE-family HTH domain